MSPDCQALASWIQRQVELGHISWSAEAHSAFLHYLQHGLPSYPTPLAPPRAAFDLWWASVEHWAEVPHFTQVKRVSEQAYALGVRVGRSLE